MQSRAQLLQSDALTALRTSLKEVTLRPLSKKLSLTTVSCSATASRSARRELYCASTQHATRLCLPVFQAQYTGTNIVVCYYCSQNAQGCGTRFVLLLLTKRSRMRYAFITAHKTLKDAVRIVVGHDNNHDNNMSWYPCPNRRFAIKAPRNTPSAPVLCLADRPSNTWGLNLPSKQSLSTYLQPLPPQQLLLLLQQGLRPLKTARPPKQSIYTIET